MSRPPARRPDRRPWALAVALVLTLALGAALSALIGRQPGVALTDAAGDAPTPAAPATPERPTDPAAAAPRLAVDPQSDAQRHAREARVALHFQQAVVMLHAKEYEHALTALHQVLELAPRMPEAHVNMGYALLGMGQPAAARDFFLTAVELRPTQANAYYGLAAALEGLDDRAGARGAMRTYLHLADPESPHMRKARSALWEWESGVTGPDA
ncbi:MAG: tetratricopeptide repeat protein, partial [Chromatiales bacterium]